MSLRPDASRRVPILLLRGVVILERWDAVGRSGTYRDPIVWTKLGKIRCLTADVAVELRRPRPVPTAMRLLFQHRMLKREQRCTQRQ